MVKLCVRCKTVQVVEDVIRSVVRGALSEVASWASRRDPSRWVAPPVTPHHPERRACGLAFGRRIVAPLGVVGLLELQFDGSYSPTLVPVDAPPDPVGEQSARATCVAQYCRAVPPRVHEFVPSPVYPVLCSVCGHGELAHRQARVVEVVERVLHPARVEVVFAGLSDEVAQVRVRPPPAHVPPVVATEEDAEGRVVPVVKVQGSTVQAAWREAGTGEVDRLLAEGVRVIGMAYGAATTAVAR